MRPTTAVAAVPGARTTPPTFQDPSSNVTQLRAGPSLNPGMLPDQDDMRDANDPAIAAAAAAGLTALPAPAPGTFVPMGPMGPMGPLQPPVRSAGPYYQDPTQPPQQVPPTTVPSNPWNAPVGASRPGPASAPPPPSAPPSRGAGSRPPQADQ